MPKSLPVIPNIVGAEQWRRVLKDNSSRPSTPRIPWNFQVKSQQGGNYLTWQIVPEADGYVVEASTDGNFASILSQISLPGNQNTAYFDTVPTSLGNAPSPRYYRVRATAGTVDKPQVVTGFPTAVILSTAIAPNDTVTGPTTTNDTTTTDSNQARGRRGYYYDF